MRGGNLDEKYFHSYNHINEGNQGDTYIYCNDRPSGARFNLKQYRFKLGSDQWCTLL